MSLRTRRFAFAVSLASVTLAGAMVLLAAASCTQETVILATISETDSGSLPVPQRCTDTCPTDLYCDKASCGDMTGTCLLPPIDCPDNEAPVCGCDGVTYFNTCLRKANGIPSDTDGECLPGNNLCGGPTDAGCPNGAVCAQLGGFPHGACPPQAPGTCWVLPAVCPNPPTAPDRWDLCAPNGPQCIDTCSAIRAGGVYRRSQFCQGDASH